METPTPQPYDPTPAPIGDPPPPARSEAWCPLCRQRDAAENAGGIFSVLNSTPLVTRTARLSAAGQQGEFSDGEWSGKAATW